MTALYIIIAALAGVLIGFFVSRSMSASKISALTVARGVEEQKVKSLQESLAAQSAASEKSVNDLKQQHERDMEQMQARQKELFGEQLKAMAESLRTSSEEVMLKRQEQLAAANKEQLAAILNPLNSSIAQMKDAVEKSKESQQRDTASLRTAIDMSLSQAKAVGESADRLAAALTSENKAQGNFGELKLKNLLDSMGFTEGLEYETQAVLRDSQGRQIKDAETGKGLIPDVILHFPDHRDMVIDSKMSVKAFEDYQSAKTDDERADALKRHIASVRHHVKELSTKDYSRYVAKGNAHLDFVIMYMFSESALQLAVSNDPDLWNDAYHSGVLITGSQNMYALLRILEISWRQMKQVENQEKIMSAASSIVSRVQILAEHLATVDGALKKTQEALDKAKALTQPSGRSITTAANQLVKYGARIDQRHKPLPQEDEQ